MRESEARNGDVAVAADKKNRAIDTAIYREARRTRTADRNAIRNQQFTVC